MSYAMLEKKKKSITCILIHLNKTCAILLPNCVFLANADL